MVWGLGGVGGVMGLAADNHFMILAQVSVTAATHEKLPPFQRSVTTLR